MDITTTQGMKQALTDKLRLGFGVTPEEADDAQVMRAAALVLRDVMTERGVESRMATRREEKRKVHYLSMEFLLGRSLEKNAYNLGVSGVLREAIGELGFRAADIFEVEPDAGLGNGGLGRLAACYLDSMTTLDIPAAGYSICYELGIFRQRIVDGQQVELPDNWKDIGGAWLMPKPQETEEVLFGGTIRKFWDNGRLHVVPEGATKVLAVPCDMEITGYGTEHVNLLRLWDAKSPTPVDMSLFSQGEYLRASEQEAMAETIAKILYPEDNHYEGKSLRLKQQYFFVSATMQSIMRKHIEVYGTAANFHEKNVIQINDTHPALVIPELMRASTGIPRGTSRKIPSPTRTTPCSLRRSSAGRSSSWRRCSRACGRSSPRSRTAIRSRSRTSTMTPPRPRSWPSSGTDRCAWRTCASRAAWQSTAFPRCTPTSCATTYSAGSTRWSRRSSRTSPTASTTAAGSRRSTRGSTA